MTTGLRVRGAITAAALVLPLAGTAFVASPAQAANDPRPIASAADWVAGQLTSGLVVGPFGADAGLTIDAAVALQVATGHTSDVTTIRGALNNATVVGGYIGDGTTEAYAGPTAKLLTFDQATGGNGTFGTVNLVNRLDARIATTAGVTEDGSRTPAPSATSRTRSARPTPLVRSPLHRPAKRPRPPASCSTSSARRASSGSPSLRPPPPPRPATATRPASPILTSPRSRRSSSAR